LREEGEERDDFDFREKTLALEKKSFNLSERTEQLDQSSTVCENPQPRRNNNHNLMGVNGKKNGMTGKR